jgi:hypothetical protein
MRRLRSRWIPIVLVCVHVALTTAGEALHLLPGLGHFESICGGVCMWVGAAEDCHPPAESNLPGGAWSRLGDRPGEVRDGADCPICHLVSLAYNRTAAQAWTAPAPFCGHLPSAPRPRIAFCGLTLHAARAPPCADYI